MTQPSFWCIDNIGDATPFVHGGAFVMVDMRGTYPTELLILEPYGRDRYGDPTNWRRITVQCERLFGIKIDGKLAALSDNRFHPDLPVWWGSASDMESIAASYGRTVEEVVSSFLSSNQIEVAQAYKDICDSHGYDELASNQVELSREDAKSFVKAMERQIEQAKHWHDGMLLT